jgi:hypothetical protein
MNIKSYNFSVDSFDVKENLQGKCSIYPNYSYTLIPPTENKPCIFKVVVNQELVGDVSGKILFDSNSVTEINNGGKVPSEEFLYQLILSTCRDSSLELGKAIIKKTDVQPVLIPPPTHNQCHKELQLCITRAFPIN